MKTTLILVGRTTNKLYQDSIEDYKNRICHYMPFEITVIPELKNTKNITKEQQSTLEGKEILKQLQTGDTVILLDERGKEFRSVEFAAWISKKRQTTKRLVFVIGGPYGFSNEVYERANDKISFSKMTFSHQMIRLFAAEQLYRACTIINNEPYHHE